MGSRNHAHGGSGSCATSHFPWRTNHLESAELDGTLALQPHSIQKRLQSVRRRFRSSAPIDEYNILRQECCHWMWQDS